MKSEHSQWFLKSPSKDNAALIHSLLQAHSPDICLEHSISEIHFSLSTLSSSSVEFPLLSINHSPRSALYNMLWIAMTRLDCPTPAERCSYMPLKCFSNIRLCRSQCSGSMWHSVFFSWRYWHTSYLHVRGFTGRHSTRRCCPLLQYSYPVLKLLVM